MSDLDLENKPIEEKETNIGLPNGLSNGISEHKSSKEDKHRSKDKDRDKDRDKDKDKHRDKDRHKSSHKDKDRNSSSHKSSHKDKDRDKDRHRDKDRDKHRDKDKDRSDRDKEKSRDKDDKHKDKARSDKDKERREKDKERSNKDKERSDKDKERSDKDKERSDKDKERSDKDKDRSKDKEKSRDKDKERSRDKEREKSSSSSSKKDRHHSSHKSSHKDKHKDKEREREKINIKQEKLEEPKLKEIKEERIEKVKEEKMEEDLVDGHQSYMQDESSVHSESANMKDDSDEDSQLVIKEEKMEFEEEEEDEDDIPLSVRKRIKIEKVEKEEEDDDYDKPLIARKRGKPKRKKAFDDDDEDDEDFKPAKKKVKKEKTPRVKKEKVKKEKNNSTYNLPESPTKGKKKKEEEENVWRWWEEEKRDDGKKWTFLEHKGPVFADSYVRLPSHVKFYYKGEHIVLSESAEEVACFYSKMLDHDYTSKKIFNDNFFKDWRKTMTAKEKEKFIDLSKCDFRKMHAHFVQLNEDRKNRTKEEKKALKEKNEKIIAEYGWCTTDGHRQRIGNFKIEPPGLFRGRGEHPKQGMLKTRIMPEDVKINCSKDSKIPAPPPGHKWKEVRHDPTVTWLACWNENIQGSTKYVMLNAASKLKGEKDWQKYETARKLHKHVDKIRENYRLDWKSKEMRIRQRGVALYFIDKLALRAGNEKDEDQADTVGCCSLRVEHLQLFEEKDGKQYVVVFDFLGKDSIRYYNEVPVEKRVFKNLQLFMENKQEGDDVFDRLNTQILNKYLNELLDGLTAKVFRTYNASRTLQEQLENMTNPEDPILAQILSYNRANREVAILCNHQRSVPKTFDKSMANLQKKIDEKKELIHDSEMDLKDLKKAAKHGSVKEKTAYDKKKKAVDRLKEQLDKLEISATDKEENKQIALGTSKLNYLDPRITVAWCKKYNIPIDKVYNKTQRQKFQWAIDMATSEYNFMNYDSKQQFTRNSGGDEEEEEEEYDD